MQARVLFVACRSAKFVRPDVVFAVTRRLGAVMSGRVEFSRTSKAKTREELLD